MPLIPALELVLGQPGLHEIPCRCHTFLIPALGSQRWADFLSSGPDHSIAREGSIKKPSQKPKN